MAVVGPLPSLIFSMFLTLQDDPGALLVATSGVDEGLLFLENRWDTPMLRAAADAGAGAWSVPARQNKLK